MQIQALVLSGLFGLFALHTAAHAAGTSITLGSTVVEIQVYKHGSGPTYFAPHNNERDAAAAAKQVVDERGGTLVALEHPGTRNISFVLKGVRYTFDPNRMFSPHGLQASLKHLGSSKDSPEAEAEVNHLALAVLIYISGESVVAVHNNEGYSLKRYQKGGVEQHNAQDIAVSTSMSPHNMFLVTSRGLFEQLKRKNYNVVLQSAGAADDGSLSVYCGKFGIPYINVETQSGNQGVQAAMLREIAN